MKRLSKNTNAPVVVVVWSYKGDSVPWFNSNHYDPSLMECSLYPWLVIKVGGISNGSFSLTRICFNGS